MTSDNHITVVATARRRVEPDTATITARTAATDSDQAAAFRLGAAAGATLLAALHVVAPDPASVRSLGVTVCARYDQERQRYDGYESSCRCQARVPIALAGAVVDAALAGGAVELEGPAYVVSDSSGIEDELLAEAVTLAKCRAEAMARAASRVVGLAQAIVMGDAAAELTQAPPMMAKLRMEASFPLASGDQELSATVTARYLLV